MPGRVTRRIFLRRSTLAAAGMWLGPAILRAASPSERLNVACIGVGGRGGSHLRAAASENLVAICDVDSETLGKVGSKFPHAKRWADYRQMLEKQEDIDAVFVATPDHHHFHASMMAIRLGKHVYCEKPLTHSIWEARTLTTAARRYKVATQMGNQGHSSEGYRLLCEYIWSGAVGDVKEVYCWTNRPIWPQGMDRPAGKDPVPSNLNWDLWIGPAAMRPYKNETYHTFKWRGWWDFGTGALGDMGCHIMDGACWALRLNNPTKVEIVESSPLHAETAPRSSVLRYHFPQRELTLPDGKTISLSPCTLTWHDGGRHPARPKDLEEGRGLAEGDNGSLFIGSKAKIMSGTYGGGTRIFPEERMRATPRPEKIIPRVEGRNGLDGHHADWIAACKGGPASSASFDYAGPFTEIVLLGNLALRLGKSIEWDAQNMRVTNAPEAQQFVRREYRKGWSADSIV